MARDSMTLDEVIQFTKQALKKVNPDKRVHTEFRFTDVQVEKLLEWLEDYKHMKSNISGWIPCSDRMPENGEEVLLAVAVPWEKGKKPRVTFGRRYDKNGKRWWSVYYCTFSDNEVTHWMPLPEPPKGV